MWYSANKSGGGQDFKASVVAEVLELELLSCSSVHNSMQGRCKGASFLQRELTSVTVFKNKEFGCLHMRTLAHSHR